MSGYSYNGTDFDDIFEVRTTTAIADVGYANNGVDLSNSYEDRGVTTAPDDVHFHKSGADLSTLFKAKSTDPNVVMPTTVTVYVADPVAAYASRADARVETDGDLSSAKSFNSTAQGSFVDIGDWVDNKGLLTSSNFQYNITKTSGTTPSGTAVHGNDATWSTITAALTWYLTRTTEGITTCELELQIREIADTGNIDSTTITLTCENGPI